MEFFEWVLISIGVVACLFLVVPLKWWIDDLREEAVERGMICKAKIKNARAFLKEYSDNGCLMANGHSVN